MPSQPTPDQQVPLRLPALTTRRSRDLYYSRLIGTLLIVILLLALYRLAIPLLLVFSAIVVASCIHLPVQLIRRHLHLGLKAAVGLSILLIFLFLSGAIAIFGVDISQQIMGLFDTLPQAVSRMRHWLQSSPVGQMMRGIETNGADANMLIQYAGSTIGNLFNVFTYLFIVVVAGIIFALTPSTYREGSLYLLPRKLRARARSALNDCGEALKMWLLGQLLAMAMVGLLISLGLFAIGVPSWLALGLLAGLAEFIPFLGPIISAIPGLIIAGSIDMPTLIKATIIYVGVQQLEGSVITPLALRQTALLPMALTLFSISAFTTLFGIAGALLATPITVAIYVLVRKLYIENYLGESLQASADQDDAQDSA